jgi:hypothetical protein
MRQPDGPQVILGKFLHGRRAHVGPPPVRIHLIAHDVARHPSELLIRTRSSFRAELQGGGQPAPAGLGNGVEVAEMIRGVRNAARVNQDPVNLRIPRLISQHNERDNDTMIRQRLDLPVQRLQLGCPKAMPAPFEFPPRRVGIRIGRDELAQIEVQGGMLDPQGQGVLHHLNLQSLFRSGTGIRFNVSRGLFFRAGSTKQAAHPNTSKEQSTFHRSTLTGRTACGNCALRRQALRPPMALANPAQSWPMTPSCAGHERAADNPWKQSVRKQSPLTMEGWWATVSLPDGEFSP